MMTNHQRARMRAQHQAPLTRAQITAYKQTGIPMSEEKAVAHLMSQLSLEQLRDLNAKCADIKASAVIKKAKATSAASPFAAACGGYADTGADFLSSNFAALQGLPSTSIDQIQSEAQIAADAELMDFISAMLRSPWTKAAAAVLAIAAMLLIYGCGGIDHSAADDEIKPALYTSKVQS